MATDKSPVRYAVIVKVAAVSIFTLVALRVALAAYFDHYVQTEELRKVGEAKPESLMSLRADEAQRLNGGSMPIENAMQQLAKRGRMAMSPEVAPTMSRDVDPLKGWVKMPAAVPARMMAEANADAAAPAEAATAVDAGPASTKSAADGGATKTATDAVISKVDGGGPHKKSP